LNEYRHRDIEVGMTESFSKQITAEMENGFRILSGDYNPLHSDDEFAREVGKMDKHVVFGMLTASLYSTLAGMYLPGKYSLIHSFEKLSFQNPVYVDDVLNVTGKVIDTDEALRLIVVSAVIRNQNDKIVSKARIKILVLE